MLFLPEYLARYSFPGKMLMAQGKAGTRAPPVIPKAKQGNWQNLIWDRGEANALKRSLKAHLPGRLYRAVDGIIGSARDGKLVSPQQLQQRGQTPAWQPTMWYRDLWPEMKAFAMPTYGDGYVRINLKDRERQGIVAPSDYDRVCDEITDMLNALRNPRNNEPLVKEIVRTHSDHRSRGPLEPDADLVVVWRQPPADMVSSPTLGNLGPIPFRETGGHRPEGFLIARGAGIAENSTLESGDVIDLAPTVLARLGLRVPEYMDGRNLLSEV